MNTTTHDLRQATIDARDWFESRAKAASKGCWSSYELQDLRAQRDALDAALATPAQAAPANEALKNAALPWPWKTDAEVLDDAISAIEGQNRLKAALRSIAARTTPAAAPAQAGEYPPLVCDYCGALTPDPWHSSGMMNGKMSKHIHSCDVCAARGAAQAARAGWNACLRNLFSLTDQTGDEAAARETSEFMRGRVFEAKGVARAMNSFGTEHCDDLQAYFTPPAAPVDAGVQKQDEALIRLMLVALEVTASDVCQVAHHKKRDQHGNGDVCPVQARHDEAITAGRARLESKP